MASLSLFLLACAPIKYPVGSWQYVQQERIARGIQPLEWDDSLFTLANERARYVAEHLTIDHDPTYFYNHVTGHAWACEVIGRQPVKEPVDALGWAWTQSERHAFCVLGSDFKKAAISAYVGSDGWVYEVMWLTD